jgi:hypothetical protein
MIVIASRYNGPPTTGNGGYCAGRFAAAADLPGAAEVTLRRPPPLETPLSLSTEDGVALVREPGGALVAEVRPASSTGDGSAAPVGWDEAVAVSAGYPGFRDHPFPTCFVCGPERAEGDGLRLFPGRLADGRTATPFVVPDDAGVELVWASLDCPGGWTVLLEGRPYVLGRMAARIDAVPAAGEHCVVMGTLTGEDGRKAFTHTTLYGQAGQALATATATWIAVN